MPRTNEVDAQLWGGRVLRVMRCGCKYDDTHGEQVDACDEHLARLRRRTVAILQQRRYYIVQEGQRATARLLAWRITSDLDRARIALAPWYDAHDGELEIIAYRTWEQVEAQLELDLVALARVGIEES